MSRRALMFCALALFGAILFALPSARAEVCMRCGQSCGLCCPVGVACYFDADGACHSSCLGGGTGKPYFPLRPSECDAGEDWDCDFLLQTPTASGASPDSIPLESALNAVSAATGVPVTAPSLKKRFVEVRHERADLGALIGSIAAQVGAVPVVRGTTDTIELVPAEDLQKRRFSPEAVASVLTMSAEFQDTDALQAARMIARAARVDIALPQGFSGRITATFRERDWKDVMESVTGAAHAVGRLQILPNGLVWIVP